MRSQFDKMFGSIFESKPQTVARSIEDAIREIRVSAKRIEEAEAKQEKETK